jgi:molybdenum cofactor guanylyltransferase
MKHPITGIILAGGKSLRMGTNKAFIEIDGAPIIDRICEIFKSLFQEIIVVTGCPNLFSYLGVKTYDDLLPERGALGGLYTGLYFSSFHHSFCVACDMPFLKKSVIQFLVDELGDEDVLVPRTADGFQPLHALYSKNCLGPVRKLLDEGGFRIFDFFPQVKCRTIEESDFLFLDPLKESFVNINTPDDLLFATRKADPERSHDPDPGDQ